MESQAMPRILDDSVPEVQKMEETTFHFSLGFQGDVHCTYNLRPLRQHEADPEGLVSSKVELPLDHLA